MLEKIYALLHKKYGTEPPESISERVKEELRFLGKHKYMDDIFELDDFISDIKCGHEPFVAVRTTSSSLILNILGMTACNPLPPHYYCPECKSVEFEDAIDGFDLPEKLCPVCGYPLERDGHNIPVEQMTAKKFPKHPFVFHLSKDAYDLLPKYFKEFREEPYDSNKIGIGNRLCAFFVNDYKHFTGKKLDPSSKPKISEICDSSVNFLKESYGIDEVSHSRFSEILFEYGRTKGRRRTETPESIRILFCEDLLLKLLSLGMDHYTAYRGTYFAARGSGVHEEIKEVLSEEDKTQIAEGRYMPSKALAIEWLCYIARIYTK